MCVGSELITLRINRNKTILDLKQLFIDEWHPNLRIVTSKASAIKETNEHELKEIVEDVENTDADLSTQISTSNINIYVLDNAMGTLNELTTLDALDDGRNAPNIAQFVKDRALTILPNKKQLSAVSAQQLTNNASSVISLLFTYNFDFRVQIIFQIKYEERHSFTFCSEGISFHEDEQQYPLITDKSVVMPIDYGHVMIQLNSVETSLHRLFNALSELTLVKPRDMVLLSPSRRVYSMTSTPDDIITDGLTSASSIRPLPLCFLSVDKLEQRVAEPHYLRVNLYRGEQQSVIDKTLFINKHCTASEMKQVVREAYAPKHIQVSGFWWKNDNVTNRQRVKRLLVLLKCMYSTVLYHCLFNCVFSVRHCRIMHSIPNVLCHTGLNAQ